MQTETTPATKPGLEGVVVAETRTSEVDGAAGRLVLGGLEVRDLVQGHDFEEACAHLWAQAAGAAQASPRPGVAAGGSATSDTSDTEGGAAVPGPESRASDVDLRARLADARGRAAARLGEVRGALALPGAMEAIRAALPLLVPEEDDEPALVAGVGVAAAAWCAARAGVDPVAEDPGAGHAASLLHRITGSPPTPAAARALDGYLVTVMDHGLNASTFAARVVASTGASARAGVIGGLCALEGPLHGGAPGPVLDMLDAVEAAGDATAWVEAELDAGRRIMGMGHRVYRVRDPRAEVLEGLARQLEEAGEGTARLAAARRVEVAAGEVLARRKPGRALRANVEFYTAVLLDALGIPRHAFTALFAASRVAGWLAHIREQRAEGRLIRPRARYVGPRPPAA